jgi:hypothetical protein
LRGKVLADVADPLEHAVHHLRLEGPGRDGVDVDAVARPLHASVSVVRTTAALLTEYSAAPPPA